MNYLKKRFYNFPLRIKFFIPFCFLFFLLFFSLTIISTSISHFVFQGNTTSMLNLFAAQVENQVNDTFEKMEKQTLTLQGDVSLLNSLKKYNQLDAYSQIITNQEINTSLFIFHEQIPELMRILCINPSTRIHYSTSRGETFSYNILSTQPWYQEILSANGSFILTGLHNSNYSTAFSDNSVVSYGKVLQDIYGNPCCVLIFDIKPETFLALSSEQLSIIQEYGCQIKIFNKNQDIIFQYPEMVSAQSTKQIKVSSGDEIGPISILITVPEEKLLYKSTQFQWISFLVLIPMLLIAFFVSYKLSFAVTSPLRALIVNMEKFKKGSYTPFDTNDRTDEIGQLTNCYNDMIYTIQKLIHDVYINELKKKEAQYETLQLQIHPHMLYNTLENIRMSAISNNDFQTSDMIFVLGQHLRLTLSDTSQLNRISDELNYIQSYLKVINIRREKKILLEHNLSDEVMNNNIIKYVFQPVIENSIIHGFANMNGICIIRIFSTINDSTLKLHIQDNGIGIEPEILDDISDQLASVPLKNEFLYETTLGIGLINIANRLRLEYGEKSNLEITSTPLVGTEVIISIPQN